MDLPDISECNGRIYNCQFSFKPDYSSIEAFIIMMLVIFFFLPFCITKLNLLLFGKIKEGVTLSSCCCSKSKRLKTKKIRKREKYKFSGKFKSKSHLDNPYGAVMNTHHSTNFLENIQLSKVNQIAPIGQIDKDGGVMFTEEDDAMKMIASRKKLSRKKSGILGKKKKSSKNFFIPEHPRINVNFSDKEVLKERGERKKSNFEKRRELPRRSDKFKSIKGGVFGMVEQRSRRNLLDLTPGKIDKQAIFHESKRNIRRKSQRGSSVSRSKSVVSRVSRGGRSYRD